jgi:hypothetical protein
MSLSSVVVTLNALRLRLGNRPVEGGPQRQGET